MPLGNSPDGLDRDAGTRAEATYVESAGGGDGGGSAGRGSGGSDGPELDPTHAIAAAIAREEDVDAVELAPLYDSIDTDSLNAVLRSAPGATLTFPHRGYEVTVTGRGAVALERLEER